MSELSREARALIDGVSTLDDPSNDDRARIRQRLALQLGATAFTAGAATHVGGATSKALAAGKTGLFGTAGKVALCAGALCAAAGSVWLLDWNEKAPAAQITRAPQVAAVPAPVEPAVAEPAVQPAAPSVALAAPEVAPRVRRKAHADVVQPPVEETKPESSSLAAELALLGHAQAALRAGKHAEALALAREHAAKFPNGTLKEERLGVAALSACGAKGTGEQAEARAFLQAAPSSPLAARVRKACGLE